jgi:hypothetical protein
MAPAARRRATWSSSSAASWSFQGGDVDAEAGRRPGQRERLLDGDGHAGERAQRLAGGAAAVDVARLGPGLGEAGTTRALSRGFTASRRAT